MKALFQKKGISKTPNREKLFYYLSFNIIQTPFKQNTTYYENIENLEPAHYLIVDTKGNVTKKRYWDIELRKEAVSMPFEEACEKFRYLFKESIRKRLRSDVPVGSCLSGGLDSSSIVRMVNTIKAKNLEQKTFSARFKNFSKDEGNHIQKVLENTDIKDFHAWVDADNFIGSFEKVFYHQEEPFGSASISAQWEVMKLVSQNNVTVLLDGQGADEYLAGYAQRFYISYLRELKSTNKILYQEELKAYIGYFGNEPELGYGGIFHEQSRMFVKSLRDAKYKYLGNRQSHLDSHFCNSISDIYYPGFVEYSLNDDLKRATLGQLTELLRYSDRDSMAFSIEVRLPFLSHELVEFVFSLPHHYKLNKGWSKYIMRKSMAGILPEEIAWRKDKIGFEAPQGSWLQSEKMQDFIADAKSRLTKEKVINPNISSQYDWQCINAAQLYI
jgi:asparagine synthase (glutamine-hydrolysing)